ncbi:MAG: hypothetical protein ACRC0G_07865 [Fusobacteriaceae bacterium]
MIPLLILNEKEFKGNVEEKDTDYTLDDGDTGGADTGGEVPKAKTGKEIPKEDSAEKDTTNIDEEPVDTEVDDYTIDGDAEEMADDEDADTMDDDENPDDGVTAESEIPDDADIAQTKKVKRLLYVYKAFQKDLQSMNSKVSDTIFPMNPSEEYIYKIVVDTLSRTLNLLHRYIVNEYNTKEYEENVYRLYHFKSQLEMIHILLKKIKKYRDESKTI